MGYHHNEKPNNQYALAHKERGGCITAYLVVVIAFNALGVLGNFSLLGDEQVSSGLVFISLAAGVAAFAGAIALWNWQAWGLWVLVANYVLGMILVLFTASNAEGSFLFGTILGSFLGLGTLYYLYNDKMDWLE